MVHCDLCGIEVKQAEYIKFEDGKNACFTCIQQNKDGTRKKLRKIKPKIISCPYCSTQYPYAEKHCTRCGSLNPLHDFHIWDLISNIGLSTLILGFLTVILISVISASLGFLVIGTINVLVLFIGLVFELFFLGVLYYLGIGLKDLFRKKK